MKKRYFLLFWSFAVVYTISAQNPIDYAIRVSADIQKSPAQIVLHWPADANVVNYYIYKKLKKDPLFPGTPVATLTKTDTSYTDISVNVGVNYEYQLIKTITSNKYYGYGYISSGIELPVSSDDEWRGKMILVYDNAMLPGLQAELSRLILDITSDGWIVVSHGVNKTDKVTDIHALIQADYNADKPNVKAVFLLGHIPVPYSGGDFSFGLNPIDGHDPQHKGAWPADVYYADMTGTWTDTDIEDTVGEYAAQHNIPGDGKFDQDIIPGKATLQLGRVDMYNMPAFAPLTEMQLLKRYLDKDHAWRTGKVPMQQRGLVKDYFGSMGGESFAASGYKNFSAMFGAQNITDTGTWENNLSKGSYLWSYGTGPGSITNASGISSTTDFTKDSLQTVFTMLFGSWFGDWNTTNNYLRAPLASKGPILTDCWSGRPQWQFHHMAMGETIGFCTLLNFNEYGIFSDQKNYFRSALINATNLRMIHVAMMGDPSLRMHVVLPPGKLTLVHNKPLVNINWVASPDPMVLGYNVYRSQGLNEPFTRINETLVSGTTFTDNGALHNKNFYMVRAVKLQTSASGSYYNMSQGSIDTITTDISGIAQEASVRSINIFPNPGDHLFHMAWTATRISVGTLKIFDIMGKEVQSRTLTGLDHLQTIDLDLSTVADGVYFVRIMNGSDEFVQRLVKQ